MRGGLLELGLRPLFRLGFIDTEMSAAIPKDVARGIVSRIPLGRTGTPEEVADVVAFLATRGDYVNGTVVHVNGGLYGG